VSANPLGRWYQRFQCPHCRKALQFDRKTNLLGAFGAGCFVAAGAGLIMGGVPFAIAVAVAAWVVLMGLSYALRGIEKG
jgi:transposase-like protein